MDLMYKFKVYDEWSFQNLQVASDVINANLNTKNAKIIKDLHYSCGIPEHMCP